MGQDVAGLRKKSARGDRAPTALKQIQPTAGATAGVPRFLEKPEAVRGSPAERAPGVAMNDRAAAVRESEARHEPEAPDRASLDTATLSAQLEPDAAPASGLAPKATPGAAAAAAGDEGAPGADAAGEEKADAAAPAEPAAKPRAGGGDEREEAAASPEAEMETAEAELEGQEATEDARELEPREAVEKLPGYEPPPVARLGGTAAPTLEEPPPMPRDRAQAIRKKSGVDPGEHHDRLRLRLQQIASRATRLQVAIVRDVEARAAEIVREVDALALDAEQRGQGYIGGVQAALGTAKSQVDAMAAEADSSLVRNAKAADTQVDEAKLTSTEAIQAAVDASSQRVRDLYAKEMPDLFKVLEEQAGLYTKKSGEGATTVKGQAQALEQRWSGSGGESKLVVYQNEKRAKVIGPVGDKKAEAITKGGTARAGAANSPELRASLTLSFLALTNPAAVHIEKTGDGDQGTDEKQAKKAQIRLASGLERSQQTVALAKQRALAKLTGIEKSTLPALAKTNSKIASDTRAQGAAAGLAIEALAAGFADAHRALMRRLRATFAGRRFFELGRYLPVLVSSARQLESMDRDQRKQLAEQFEGALAGSREGIELQLKELAKSAGQAQTSIAEATSELASIIGSLGVVLSDGLLGGASRVAAKATDFGGKVEDKLGAHADVVHERIVELTGKTKTQLETQFKAYLKDALEPETKDGALEAATAPSLQQLANAAQKDIQDRSRKIFNAGEAKTGTDEEGMWDGVRGLTRKGRSALDEDYRTITHKGFGLQQAFDDEMSGRDSRKANLLLAGDELGFVKLEMEDQIHWYGNDSKRAEEVARSLDPTELAELKKDEAWKSTIQELESGLYGDDLQVMKALVDEEDSATADGIRVKGKIDEARYAGKPDQLIDTVSGIGADQIKKRYMAQKNVSELEFQWLQQQGLVTGDVEAERKKIIQAAAQATLKPDQKGKPLSDQQAAETLATYATRDLRAGYGGRPPPSAHGGGPRAPNHHDLRTESKQAVTALLVNEPGSPLTKAALISYEVSRPGGIDKARFETAAQDPELAAARRDLKSTDEAVRRSAELRIGELEAKHSQMVVEFAKLRGAPEDVQKDPKRAESFAADSVQDLYGKSDAARKFARSMITEGVGDKAAAIHIAVSGGGTNVELIKRSLAGLTPEEIDKLKADYNRDYAGGKDPDALFKALGVFKHRGFGAELSGDARQDVEILLLGEDKSERGMARKALLMARHQLGEGTGWMAEKTMASSVEKRNLDQSQADLVAMLEAAGGSPAFTGHPPEPNPEAFDKKGNLEKGDIAKFHRTAINVQQYSQDYRAEIDRQEAFLTDILTAIVVVVGAILTVVTAGALAPVLVALIGGALTIGTKALMRGERYGWEEMMTDVGTTLLDAATAGFGASLAKGGKLATKLLPKLAPKLSAAPGLAAKEAAKRAAGRSLITGAIGSGGRAAMDERTWQDGVGMGMLRVVGHGAKGGLMSAATSYVSEGLEKKLLGTGLPVGPAGRGGPDKGLLGGSRFGERMGGTAAKGVSGVVTNFGGGLVGETTGFVLDQAGGVKGPDLLDRFKTRAWQEALQSAGGFGGHGIKDARDRRAAALRGPRAAGDDLIAQRETPEELSRQFKQAQAADPSLDLQSFLKAKDEIIRARQAVADVEHERQRDLRKGLLEGIPPKERGALAKVPIFELSDAEFQAFSGSKKGLAVTVFDDGKPMVLVRKGTDPKALREEGIHLQQAKDPAHRAKFAALDESQLKNYHALPLEQKLALYRVKLDLEIDAQQRLRAGLESELGKAKTEGERAALQQRIADSDATARALGQRLAEVESITPARAKNMADGAEPRPQYLDEPPRLFAKARGPPSDDPTLDRARRDRHDVPDERAPRKEVDTSESTFRSAEHPDAKLYRVGDLADHEGRVYRVVELVADGVVVGRREEIQRADGVWIESGTSRYDKGIQLQDAARLRNIEAAGVKLQSGDIAAEAARVDVATAAIVPIAALKDKANRPLAVFPGQGGFDDVYLHFDASGKARIVVVEAKNRGDYPRFAELGAVHENFGQNLERLRAALLNNADLPPARAAAVKAALDNWDISLEIQHAQRTKVSDQGETLQAVQQAALAWRRLGVLELAAQNAVDPRLLERVEDLRKALKAGLHDATSAEAASQWLDGFHTRVQRVARGANVELPLQPSSARGGRASWELELRPSVAIDDRFVALRRSHVEATSPIDTRPIAYSLPAARAAGLTAGGETLVDSGPPHVTRTSRVVRDAEGRHVVITAPTPQPGAAGAPRAGATLASALFEQLTRPVRAASGRVDPSHVVWDTSPLGMAELARSVRALLPWMKDHAAELGRLRLMIPAESVMSESLLRLAFGAPPGMTVRRVGDHVIVGFERPPLLLPAARPTPRPPAPSAPPDDSGPAPRRPAAPADNPSAVAAPQPAVRLDASVQKPVAPAAEALDAVARRTAADPDAVLETPPGRSPAGWLRRTAARLGVVEPLPEPLAGAHTDDGALLAGGQSLRAGRLLASESEGRAIMRRLAAGDAGALAALGVRNVPADFDPSLGEWGLGRTPGGAYVVVRGRGGDVDWSHFPDLVALAHSHPQAAARGDRDRYLKDTDAQGAPLDIESIARRGGQDLVHLFPSTGDLAFMWRRGLVEHRVFTPYVHLGQGRIGNPDQPGARIEFVIKKPARVGFQGNREAFSAEVEAWADGRRIWIGRMDAVRIDEPGFQADLLQVDPAGRTRFRAMLDADAAVSSDLQTAMTKARVDALLEQVSPVALAHLVHAMGPHELAELDRRLGPPGIARWLEALGYSARLAEVYRTLGPDQLAQLSSRSLEELRDIARALAQTPAGRAALSLPGQLAAGGGLTATQALETSDIWGIQSRRRANVLFITPADWQHILKRHVDQTFDPAAAASKAKSTVFMGTPAEYAALLELAVRNKAVISAMTEAVRTGARDAEIHVVVNRQEMALKVDVTTGEIKTFHARGRIINPRAFEVR